MQSGSSKFPRRVLITGGHGGLATAIREKFCAAGAEVLAPGREELDVCDSATVRDYFAELEPIDVLVNNAGITRDKLFARVSESDWDAVMQTNLRGAFLCSRAAARVMGERGGGHIVQIGSFSAHHPPLGQAAYAASKAGLEGLTRALAQEWGAKNIRVNCVLPGFLHTRMTDELSEVARSAALERHALGRFNTVEEAARFICFLCSLEHVSGQTFQLDSRV